MPSTMEKQRRFVGAELERLREEFARRPAGRDEPERRNGTPQSRDPCDAADAPTTLRE